MSNYINATVRRRLLVCTALTSLSVAFVPQASFAEDENCHEAMVPQPEGCRRANANVVVEMPAGANTEVLQSAPGQGFGTTGFSISLDNQSIAGAPAASVPRRTEDITAARRNVDVRYDGLDLRPMLNVATVDLRSSYSPRETVTFRASSNYPAFIARAEVLIHDVAQRSNPVVGRLPVAPNGQIGWQMPEDGSGNYEYVLRVYDAQGRYNETMPLVLNRSEQAFETHNTVGAAVTAAGEGEDRSRIRNIPLHGGRITTAGDGAPGGTVIVMGETIPVDANGRFVTSRILPAGDHVVQVQQSSGRSTMHDVNIPTSERFSVGIVDLTFGKRLQDDLSDADPDYEDTYINGRAAFYVTGQTDSGLRYTASADTGDGPIDEAFERLESKDPRRVIARMDPEDLYPTYGDDSTAYDDTPTSGRFYVRVEKDASSLMWGDFKADLQGGEFMRDSRALYGAELRYVSPNVTNNGDARAAATVYVAQPDTLPQSDILRGTGGSVYFLTRQDINGGSETLRIQTVDPVTGRVVSEQRLREGVDYEIDYLQGVVILTQPLNSSSNDGSLIGGASGAYDVNLVAQYEYTPTASDLDGASVGARAEVWVGDNLRLGATVAQDSTGSADQEFLGGDLRYNTGERSYVEAEFGRSEGPGFGNSTSTDGGLTIVDSGVVANPAAQALRVETHLEFGDLGLAADGFANLYYEEKEAGFSTLNQTISEDQELIGANLELGLSENTRLAFDIEDFSKSGGDGKTEAELRLAYDLGDHWSVTAGLAYLDQTNAGSAADTGERTDFGLRVDYDHSDDLSLYAFGQTTLDNSGGLDTNNRFGLGVDAQLSEKLAVSGEVSDGDGGFGGQARLRYSATADNEVYLGYTLDPTRTGAGYQLVGNDQGTLVFGGRHRHSDTISTYFENKMDFFGSRQSLADAYGVTYTPDARWTFSGGIETGEVRDSNNGDFHRDALSFGFAYANNEDVKSRLRLEYRTEDGDGIAQDRETWALSGGYEYKVDDDWRLLANVDALYSTSDESSFRNGEYAEASIGYAYRPVDNERTNLLFRYTYLHDLPGEDQVTASGSTDGPMQKSHVLSVDGIFDLSQHLSVGGKYGYRSSEVAARGTDDFTGSTAHLGIIRFDWHVVHNWDVLVEGRGLHTEESSTDEFGALLAVYRHFGNNAKLGLGYEWGQVSDDMTDIDYVGQEVFLNLVAKF